MYNSITFKTTQLQESSHLTELVTLPFDRAPDLHADAVHLSHLGVEHVSDQYVAWMNDYEVVRLTESRFSKHTRQSTEKFVRNVEADNNSIAWAIGIGSDHIGNIKLGPVDRQHSFAYIGLIIGLKNSWGNGYGTQAIKLVADWAFNVARIHKLSATFYDENGASVRAFEKAGFQVEARESSHYFLEGNFCDRLTMAKINPSDESMLTQP